MFRFQTLSLFTVLIFSSSSGLLFAEKTESYGAPNPGVPELKELIRFQGEWEAQLGNSDQKIPSKRKWTLDGHFLKHGFEVSGGALGNSQEIAYRSLSHSPECHTARGSGCRVDHE